MVNYNDILRELFNYYQSIYLYIENEYRMIIGIDDLIINFKNDFSISSVEQDGFIKYDYNNKKFLLNYNSGINKYNSLTRENFKLSANDKYNNNIFDYYSKDDISSIIQLNNIKFIDYVKSEFLKEYFTKIIHVISKDKMEYSDDFGNYSKNNGYYFNQVICEIESRMFTKKYYLLSVPRTLGNKKIINIARNLLNNKITRELILTKNDNLLFQSLKNSMKDYITQYEYNCFEQEFKINSGTLNYEIYNSIFNKTSKE